MGLTRHDGLGVYGSGLFWTGKKGGTESDDKPFFGNATTAGGQIGAVRCDGGKTNVSAAAFAVSTSLSTVITTIGSFQTSGLGQVAFVCSGNCVDIVCRSMSGTASSGVIGWVAFGY